MVTDGPRQIVQSPVVEIGLCAGLHLNHEQVSVAILAMHVKNDSPVVQRLGGLNRVKERDVLVVVLSEEQLVLEIA